MFPKPSVLPMKPLLDITSLIEVSNESVLRFLIRPSWPRTRSVVTAYSAVRHAMMLKTIQPIAPRNRPSWMRSTRRQTNVNRPVG